MQWMLLAGWFLAIMWFTSDAGRIPILRFGIAAGLLTAMLMQLLLLHGDGLLSVQTGLPLHLCGAFAIVYIPLLWRTPEALYEALMYLGSPAAALALLFPAVLDSSHPVLMKWAFGQLHALLALAPLFFIRTGKPLPTQAHRALLWGNGYLVFVCVFNRVFQSNYLFLRAAPLGTPLAWLFSKGSLFYLCALEILCMLGFILLKPLYAQSRKYVIM